MRVPVFGLCRLLEYVGHAARLLRLGHQVHLLSQSVLIDTHEAPFVCQMPMCKIAVFVLAVERVVDFNTLRKNCLGDVQNFAAVSSVAIFLEVLIRVLLESYVVSLRGVGRGCCQAPAHVFPPCFVVAACVFVKIMLRDLTELQADVVRDVFNDLWFGVGGGEVLIEECFVEGEDAFDFDAEGDTEGGVDHVGGVLRI